MLLSCAVALQKAKGKKGLAAAAPPPKPSGIVIAPPAPRSEAFVLQQ